MSKKVLMTVIAFLLIVSLFGSCGDPDTQSTTATPTATEQQKPVEPEFWFENRYPEMPTGLIGVKEVSQDGGTAYALPVQIEQEIKNQLNDPDSFKARNIGWMIESKDGVESCFVMVEFTAKNGFGGTIKAYATYEIHKDGTATAPQIIQE